MGATTISDFIKANAQRDASAEMFELESPHMLEIKLDGRVWSKAGAMIAYHGAVKFRREGMMEQGLGNLLKKAISGEGMRLMKAEGKGRVYVADAGKRVTLLRLANEAVFVNGNDVLAFEDGIEHQITMMRRVAGMMAGGLFNIRLAGTGVIAITTHYQPLVLQVKPEQPVFTDPNATVAWSSSLTPDFSTDIQIGTFFGRGSGESIQLKFQGAGWVVVQPYEEVYAAAQG
jgi:uncharacterized protein (AIM24 family)